MLKLIKLELRKFKISGFIKGALITAGSIFALLMLIFWTSAVEGDAMFTNAHEAVDLITTIVNDAFLIFAAAMLSKYVIGEYKNHTVNILFTYPISRKKIIYAKLILVAGFMIVTMITASTVILVLFYLANVYLSAIPLIVTGEFLFFALSKVVIYAFSFACISSLCLYFGMRKKSTVATIVSSVIIVSILGSTSNGFSLSSIVIIPVTVAAIGLFLTYMTFRNIEHVDI